jgi:hypothetical protein
MSNPKHVLTFRDYLAAALVWATSFLKGGAA